MTCSNKVMGDCNTLNLVENVCSVFQAAGYRSAYRDVHGCEPEKTWPSGIVAPFMDLDGIEIHPEGVCLDYIWVGVLFHSF